MTDIILRTKLHIPVLRSSLVRRPRLIEKLNAGMEGRLILVSAQAGSGKTTLVAEWLRQSDCQAVWFSLDESDNDPRRFVDYLLAALRQIQAETGTTAQAILQSPQPVPDEVLMSALVNDIAYIPQPFILVLDDYQIIHVTQIHGRLNFLLEHQPPNMHMVIITREDPPLSLSRMRARGQLAEIRQADLRFSQQECADFLQLAMDLELSMNDVLALERRTEGWIAGLQLAALSIRGQEDASGFIQAFTGSSRFILDYLMEEVFERQAPEIKDFLLKTSILERLSASLCDLVAERTDSQLLLENLEQANLFIVPLDQSRTWYRYHQLFADLLCHRLRLSLSESEASLHMQASDWFERNGYYPEAIQHALTARDWAKAKQLLSHVSTKMLNDGQVTTLIQWYSTFPTEVMMADPRLSFDYSWPLLLAGRFDTAAPLLDCAEQLARGIPEFLGEVFTAQAFLARGLGDNTGMVEKSEQALALLSKNSINSRGLVALNLGLAYWHMGKMVETETVLAVAIEAGEATGNIYSLTTARILQGRVLAVRGQLHQAQALFEQAIQSGGMIPINALAHLDLCALHYEWNDLPESERQLLIAMELSQRGRNDEFLVACWVMMSYLRVAQGRGREAEVALGKAQELANTGKIPAPTMDRLDAARVELALTQYDTAAARRSSSKLKEDVDAHSFYRFVGLTKARWLLMEQKRKEAQEYLEGLYTKCFTNQWQYGLIAVRIVEACAADGTNTALDYLAEALFLAEPEGYVRVFVDAGQDLIPLLQEALRRNVSREYIHRILAEAGAKPDEMGSGNRSLIEPLSEREIDVLRLVMAGMSNREIAARLFISAGTAKTHIHHLCGKLGVRNRTEAAMRAKDLGLA